MTKDEKLKEINIFCSKHDHCRGCPLYTFSCTTMSTWDEAVVDRAYDNILSFLNIIENQGAAYDIFDGDRVRFKHISIEPIANYGEKKSIGYEEFLEKFSENWKKYSEESSMEAKSHHISSSQDAKADSGKLPMNLVPTQIVRDIAQVRQYGNDKYGDPDNWRNVEKIRYVAALERHLLAYKDYLNGDDDGFDKESKIEHYKHMACNMAFICDMEKWEKDADGANHRKEGDV